MNFFDIFSYRIEILDKMCYNTFTMKNLVNKVRLILFKKEETKFVSDQKQEALIKLGKEQFQKLLEKGLSFPVMTL